MVSAMPPLPRLALLLRVGGSLDEGIAMRVLDQDEAGYQHLLADACPRDAHGQPDASAWRQLAEQVQARIRELPAARLQQLQHERALLLSLARAAGVARCGCDFHRRRRLDHQPGTSHRCKKTRHSLFCGVFPVFVPSLSW